MDDDLNHSLAFYTGVFQRLLVRWWGVPGAGVWGAVPGQSAAGPQAGSVLGGREELWQFLSWYPHTGRHGKHCTKTITRL